MTLARCFAAVEASFIFDPTAFVRPETAREAEEERGTAEQSGRYRVRDDWGNVSGSRKVGVRAREDKKKSNRGFECSPEKALRSYLAESIMLHRMWLPLCLNQIMHPGNCSHIRKKLHPTSSARSSCPIHLRGGRAESERKYETNDDGYNVDDAINTLRTCQQHCCDQFNRRIMKQKQQWWICWQYWLWWWWWWWWHDYLSLLRKDLLIVPQILSGAVSQLHTVEDEKDEHVSQSQQDVCRTTENQTWDEFGNRKQLKNDSTRYRQFFKG